MGGRCRSGGGGAPRGSPLVSTSAEGGRVDGLMWYGCSDLGGFGGGAGGGAGCGAQGGGGEMCGGRPDGEMRVCWDELQRGPEVSRADWDVGCKLGDGHAQPLLQLSLVQRGHLGVGHIARDNDAEHVSAADPAGVDVGTRRFSSADSVLAGFRGPPASTSPSQHGIHRAWWGCTACEYSTAHWCRCSGANAPRRFSEATAFNEDISEWDTSSVTRMDEL